MKEITLKFSQEQIDRLESLQELAGASEIEEVIRKAIAVYECLQRAKAQGETVVLRSPTRERDLIL